MVTDYGNREPYARLVVTCSPDGEAATMRPPIGWTSLMATDPKWMAVASLLWLACGSTDGGDGPFGDAGDLENVAGGSHVDGGQGGEGSGGRGGDARGVVGAGASDGGGDASKADPPRRFLLASTGTQLRIDGPRVGLQLTEANLAADVDVVAVHQEFYGVPWQAFRDGTEPPPQWSATMAELSASAHALSDRVFLSISMLDGQRESLAERTMIEDGWAARCYDFATAADGPQLRDAYLRYVEHMVETFEPTYLNFAIEVNLFLEKCPAAAPGLIEVADAAYAAAKSGRPDVIAFPSFQIDHLYGHADDSCPAGMDQTACFDRNYAQIADMQRDRFAMSSYPFLQGRRVEDVSDDHFARGPARGGERGLIAETGWLSTGLVAQNGLQCDTVIAASEADAAAYLERVLSDADRLPLELVTWWSNRDLLPAGLMTNCPCDYGPTWCEVVDVFRSAGGGPRTPDAEYFGEILLKAFGTMGLRDYDGQLKRSLAIPWEAARMRPIAP
jgi:hypothetical protein